MIFVVAMAVALVLPVFMPGCGSGPSEYDKAAHYTPDALAQELILRFRRLNPDSKISRRDQGKAMSKQAIAARAADKKGARTKLTKEKGGETTIDDVLEDIASKFALIQETPPAETIKKMNETIASDRTLSDSEKKTLTELVGRLAN